MNEHTQERRDHGFVLGLLAGTAVGAGLAMWFAPRSGAQLRRQLTDSARGLGDRFSERFEHATARVGDAVDDLARKGQNVRDDVADAVARGAHEVERYATAAKTDAVAEPSRPTVANRSSSRSQAL